MKLSPWNLEQHSLTKAQLPAPGVPTYPRPTHTHTFCPCLLYTYQELRSGETSFLPCRTQPGRRWFYCSVTQGTFLSSILARNTEVGIAAIQVCPEHPPSPLTSPQCPSRAWVMPVKSQSNSDCVGSVYGNIPILWLFFCITHHYGQSDGGMQSSQSQLQLCHLQLAAEWPRAGSSVYPGAQGHLRPPQELNREAQRQQLSCKVSSKTAQALSESSTFKANWARLQWFWNDGAETALHTPGTSGDKELRLLPGYTTYPHNYLMPFKAKSPSHCPSHSPISLHKQALEREAGKKTSKRLCILFMQIRTLTY